jgi:hypothetical protein
MEERKAVTKVYLVAWGVGPDYQIDSIWSTREKAERVADEANALHGYSEHSADYRSVEEWEVDPPV